MVIFEKPGKAKQDTRRLEKGKCGTYLHTEEGKTEEHGNYRPAHLYFQLQEISSNLVIWKHLGKGKE